MHRRAKADLRVQEASPCLSDVLRASTGCAVHCKPREQRWQLALLLSTRTCKAHKHAQDFAAPDFCCSYLER